MIVAIDGPAGAGKSTIAKKLAQKLGFLYIDTGAMYRAFTLNALEEKIDFDDINALVELAKTTEVKLSPTETGQVKVFMNGLDVSEKIRTPELTNAVFQIARLAPIREVMVGWQRAYGASNDIVMEGRDIGTVVFPQADIKFFLDANIKERAKRRFNELTSKGVEVNLETLKQQIEDRDYKDKNRASGPLKKAEDSIVIDSTSLDIPEVVELLLTKIQDA